MCFQFRLVTNWARMQTFGVIDKKSENSTMQLKTTPNFWFLINISKSMNPSENCIIKDFQGHKKC